MAIEVDSVPVVEILVRVGVVGVVLVRLHLLLARVLVLGWVILAGVASSLTVVDRDVAVLAPTPLPLGCLTFQRES